MELVWWSRYAIKHFRRKIATVLIGAVRSFTRVPLVLMTVARMYQHYLVDGLQSYAVDDIEKCVSIKVPKTEL